MSGGLQSQSDGISQQLGKRVRNASEITSRK
jgi:hypothetical protein